MSMVSNTFLLFVLAVLILYYLVPAKAQWIVLLIFSYLYYVSGNARYLFYILYSTIIVYGFGLLIDHLQQKGTDQKVLKRIVSLGLFCNLGMLGIVKYSGFFADSEFSFQMGYPGHGCYFPIGHFVLYVSIIGLPVGCLLEKYRS